MPVYFGAHNKRARIARMKGNCRIMRGVLQKLLAAARRDPSHECCGLLAGRAGEITTIFAAQNSLSSSKAYEIAPRELFSIFRKIRAENLELLGIYHSHPETKNTPSAKDIAYAYYPDALYFIISPKPDAPKPIRAFRIRDGNVTELSIEEAS
jgi:[CysO sulfur-carrier protein]-S-L-cysteine hydrolase